MRSKTIKNLNMENNQSGSKKYTFSARAKSFYHAFSGIRNFIRTEPNALIHLTATVLVILGGWLFRVSATEGSVLALAVGLVWVAEMFNTCMEKIIDFISIQEHPEIKLIKDCAAGAVLISSLAALAAGLFIFIPKII